MVLASLREALSRASDTPVLWIPGLFTGLIFALVLILEARGVTFLGARAGFLGLVALPFFLGGAYAVTRGDDRDLPAFLSAGRRFFFGVLLAWAVVISGIAITFYLVMIPFALAGGAFQATGSFALLSLTASILFFTYFSDTAVVLEERKVLDSIRRSVEFILGQPKETLLFYLTNLAIGALIFFLSVVIWSFFIADRMELLLAMNQSALQTMTPDQFMAIIGPAGIWSGVAIGFFAILVGTTVLVPFKACFFRRSVKAPSAPLQGEFDEKGRWYRY